MLSDGTGSGSPLADRHPARAPNEYSGVQSDPDRFARPELPAGAGPYPKPCGLTRFAQRVQFPLIVPVRPPIRDKEKVPAASIWPRLG
jgi:hypothetical protein